MTIFDPAFANESDTRFKEVLENFRGWFLDRLEAGRATEAQTTRARKSPRRKRDSRTSACGSMWPQSACPRLGSRANCEDRGSPEELLLAARGRKAKFAGVRQFPRTWPASSAASRCTASCLSVRETRPHPEAAANAFGRRACNPDSEHLLTTRSSGRPSRLLGFYRGHSLPPASVYSQN